MPRRDYLNRFISLYVHSVLLYSLLTTFTLIYVSPRYALSISDNPPAEAQNRDYIPPQLVTHHHGVPARELGDAPLRE